MALIFAKYLFEHFPIQSDFLNTSEWHQGQATQAIYTFWVLRSAHLKWNDLSEVTLNLQNCQLFPIIHFVLNIWGLISEGGPHTLFGYGVSVAQSSEWWRVQVLAGTKHAENVLLFFNPYLHKLWDGVVEFANFCEWIKIFDIWGRWDTYLWRMTLKKISF